MMRGLTCAVLGASILMSAPNVEADTLFFDDFESGSLVDSKWSNPGSGTVVEDSGSKVLSFNQTTSGGDVFTSEIINIVTNQLYELRFDYRGEENGNGFVGISRGTPGAHFWVAGTQPSYLRSSGGNPNLTVLNTVVLEDQVGWKSYAVRFYSLADQNIRLMFEDFTPPGQSYNPEGAAFFDNISLAAVPLPPAAIAGGVLMGGIALYRGYRRRRLG